MFLNDLFDYKNQLMRDLCTNEKIVKLITDREDIDVPNHDLAYTQVFPYEFVPETVDNGHTIVCFDVDIASVPNKTFYIPYLYVWIFSHKSKFKLKEGGVRMDALASEIDAVINGSRYYGLGELELESVARFSPITDYHGRVLIYHAREFNRAGTTGLKRPPANRKNPYGTTS